MNHKMVHLVKYQSWSDVSLIYYIDKENNKCSINLLGQCTAFSKDTFQFPEALKLHYTVRIDSTIRTLKCQYD